MKSLTPSRASAPAVSEYFVWSQAVELTGVEPRRLAELIHMGWIEPVVTVQRQYLFTRTDLARLARFERVRREFEASSLAGSLIIDLVERIDRLEKRLKRLDSGFPGARRFP